MGSTYIFLGALMLFLFPTLCLLLKKAQKRYFGRNFPFNCYVFIVGLSTRSKSHLMIFNKRCNQSFNLQMSFLIQIVIIKYMGFRRQIKLHVFRRLYGRWYVPNVPYLPNGDSLLKAIFSTRMECKAVEQSFFLFLNGGS